MSSDRDLLVFAYCGVSKSDNCVVDAVYFVVWTSCDRSCDQGDCCYLDQLRPTSFVVRASFLLRLRQLSKSLSASAIIMGEVPSQPLPPVSVPVGSKTALKSQLDWCPKKSLFVSDGQGPSGDTSTKKKVQFVAKDPIGKDEGESNKKDPK